jgi:hypothetical protein
MMARMTKRLGSIIMRLALGTAMAMGFGCAATDNADSSAEATAKESSPNASGLSPLGEMARKILPNTDNGLEVRKVLLTGEQAVKLAAFLDARQQDQPALPENVMKRLAQNGWRFVKVPTADVDIMLSDVGQLTVDVREWHGQAPDWRPLQERTIGTTPRALAIDGRIGRFDRGTFALMIRSWTVQSENGPFLYMEALPWYQPPRTTDLRRLMGDPAAQSGQALGSMAMDLMMDSDFGYVLLAAAPTVDAVTGTSATSPSATRRKPAVGPSEDEGASHAATMTIGEFLMTTDRTPGAVMRVVFVFQPRIGSTLDSMGIAAIQEGGDRG